MKNTKLYTDDNTQAQPEIKKKLSQNINCGYYLDEEIHSGILFHSQVCWKNLTCKIPHLLIYIFMSFDEEIEFYKFFARPVTTSVKTNNIFITPQSP